MPSEEFTIVFTNRECHDVDCSVGQLPPGDFNLDTVVDISDAIGLLEVLLRGEGAVPCAAGDSSHSENMALLDWNADSELDLSDPVALVSLVRWAFLGEAQHDLGFSCRGFMACPSACSTE